MNNDEKDVAQEQKEQDEHTEDNDAIVQWQKWLPHESTYAKCRIANENPTAACLGELRNKFMETESSITAIPGFQMPANQTKTCGERKLYCAKDTGALELN